MGNKIPVAWMFQHDETGKITYVDHQQVEWGFEKNNPRWQKIYPVYLENSEPEFTNIGLKKLESLQSMGFEINGYSVYNKDTNKYGFVTTAGMVGWWYPRAGSMD